MLINSESLGLYKSVEHNMWIIINFLTLFFIPINKKIILINNINNSNVQNWLGSLQLEYMLLPCFIVGNDVHQQPLIFNRQYIDKYDWRLICMPILIPTFFFIERDGEEPPNIRYYFLVYFFLYSIVWLDCRNTTTHVKE